MQPDPFHYHAPNEITAPKYAAINAAADALTATLAAILVTDPVTGANAWAGDHMAHHDLQAGFDAINAGAKALYDTIRPDLSPLLAQNGHEFKYYDLADPEPRAPKSIVAWNLGAAPTGSAAPTEVAICLSYQAAKISGLPQARRRGRVYIGPLNTATIDATARVASATLARFDTAGTNLLAASTAATDWTWKQHSTLELGLADVADGWVENEFDTQRRRGRPYTVRAVFP